MSSSSTKPPLIIGLLNGPNLGTLGKRSPEIYGSQTLKEIESSLHSYAQSHNTEVFGYQSNVEGFLIDTLQEKSPHTNAWIINPGALSTSGYALADALMDIEVPVVEVHISKVFQREAHRHHSVISPHCYGQIIGFGAQGYLMALKALLQILSP